MREVKNRLKIAGVMACFAADQTDSTDFFNSIHHEEHEGFFFSHRVHRDYLFPIVVERGGVRDRPMAMAYPDCPFLWSLQ